MLVHPQFDPVVISIGPLSIHWYGVMYVLAFFTGLYLGKYRARQANSGWSESQVDDVLLYIVAGVIVGGRLGYALFYGWEHWTQDIFYLFKIWEGGMSFHGGLIGVVVAIVLFARNTKKSILHVGDFIAPLIPTGLMFGRLGNFINQELWGRATDLPWGMIFPAAMDNIPRHPSPLYQALGEGLFLFLILWWFSSKQRPTGSVAGLFLVGYAVFRIIAEIFREPDAHIGFLMTPFLTMGMILSIPMFLAGLVLIIFGYRNNKSQ